MNKDKPVIILFDLETSLNVAATFSLYPDAISPKQILQERIIICAAYKYLGQPNVKAVSILDSPGSAVQIDVTNDEYVVKHMHKVLSKADAVIAHYGDAFDMRIFNARAIKHGLLPLPPVVQIDTYKIARRKFKFNSNKLDYLGQYLGVGKKMETGGIDLWLKCLAGDRKAIQKMVKYNKQDVVLLEKIYEKLCPYDKTAQLNMNLFTDGIDVCPMCGDSEVIKYGFKITRTGRYQRYQCKACGHISQDTRREKENKINIK